MKFKAFVINMKGSSERLAFMTKQLNGLGIDFTVHEGVNGKTFDFTNVYDESLSIKLNGSILTSAEKGCALSHIQILEEAQNEELDYTLIMEDDIELSKNFKIILDTILSNREENKTDWEYLSFNYPSVGFKFINLWLYLLSENFRKNSSLALYVKIPIYVIKFIIISIFSFFEGLREKLYKKIYKYGKPAKFYRPIYLAGCYLVNKEGVKKLLSEQKKILYPADRIQNVLRIKKHLKLFHFVPLIAKQRRDIFKSIIFDYSKSKKEYVYSKYD